MKYAVIFGSESGLAKAAVSKLLQNDFVVFGFDVKCGQSRVCGNLHTMHADVTVEADVVAAVRYVSSYTDRIHLLSSFCGIVTLGSLVELPTQALEKILAVNLVGVARVNSAFFQLLANGGGRIVNISSEYARIAAVPFHGYYGIAKHALDVYNDSLRRELSSSPVSVVAIRPGAFATNMQAGVQGQFDRLVKETQMYRKPLEKMQSIMVGELKKAKDPEIFAKVYLKAATKKHPKRYYNVNNSFKMKLLSALPRGLADAAFAAYFK